MCVPLSRVFDITAHDSMHLSGKGIYIIGMCANPKVGSESVLENPNRTELTSKSRKSKRKVGFPWHFEKPKTEIEQPQFFQCLFNNGVILQITLYITDAYVYDSL